MSAGGSDGHCQLCGKPARLVVAPLRVAWERRTVMVRVCSGCSGSVWRSAEELRAENYREAKAAALPGPMRAREALGLPGPRLAPLVEPALEGATA